MIATWMALRSRILRVALEKMLNDIMDPDDADKSVRQRMGNVVKRFFLKEFDGFKYTMAGKFYKSPAIKYLSDNGGELKTYFSQTKPSYISADMFAETLLQLLKDKGTGATDMDKIKFCLQFNTHHIGPATLKNLRDHAENSGNDINVLKDRLKGWYNETMDRATGWYKRKLQLILFWLGLIVAIMFNVDTIQIVKILSKDKEARSQLVTMGIELSKDSVRYGNFIKGKSDSLRSQAILDSGYAHITKDIDDANLVLGLGWPMSDLIKNEKTYIDSEKNEGDFRLVKNYQSIFNRFPIAFIEVQNKLGSLKINRDSLIQQLIIYKSDTTVFRLQQTFASDSIKKLLIDTILKTKPLINLATNSLGITEAKINIDSAQLAMLIESRKEATRQINENTPVKSLLIDSIITGEGDKILFVCSHRPYTNTEKAGYIIRKNNPFRCAFWSFIFSLQFLGLFVTALMLSLGAPFWFDLLKKLVAIRGAGVKPEEKEDKLENSMQLQPIAPAAIENTIGLNTPVSDVYEEALRVYAPEIRKIPGVKAVFSVTKHNIKLIQINVDTDDTKKEVLDQFPQLLINNIEISKIVKTSGNPLTHAGTTGIISNQSGKNGYGSLGCILEAKETGFKHLLSCWHVLKGDFNYSDSDNQPIIIDYNNGEEIAERWAGGIRDQFDYGLALCQKDITYQDNSFLKTKLSIPSNKRLSFRFVTRNDIDKQLPIKYYDSIDGVMVTGLIYTDTPEVDISYIDKNRIIKDILILTDANEQTISKEGNSGSIIFDMNDVAIAMIIGGDLNYTYAVRLSHIFNIHEELTIA